MKDVIKKINDFLGMTTGLLINLIVAGTIIGILYDDMFGVCLLYTSPSPRDVEESRMPSSA